MDKNVIKQTFHFLSEFLEISNMPHIALETLLPFVFPSVYLYHFSSL